MTSLDDVYKKLFKNETDKYIFVYTPPKVGSTTLVTSLRMSLGKSVNIIHIHDEIMLKVLTGIEGVRIVDLIQFICSLNKTVYVIDIYRDPIERKMSEFFQKIASLHFNNKDENVIGFNMVRIISRFNDLFPHIGKEDYYFTLFHNNIKPFNFEKKYINEQLGAANYIKLRLNDVSIWGNILTTVLNTKIVIINDYQTENKLLGDLYKRFKTEYVIPNNLLHLIKDDQAMNFFLSSNEREDYLNLWDNKCSEYHNHFTPDQYNLYLKISLENQYYDQIERFHYLDNGCFCDACNVKRREIYIKAANNEPVNEKIIHENCIIEYNHKMNQENARKLQIAKKKNKLAYNKKNKLTYNKKNIKLFLYP
jgi:hypothetical protein